MWLQGNAEANVLVLHQEPHVGGESLQMIKRRMLHDIIQDKSGGWQHRSTTFMVDAKRCTGSPYIENSMSSMLDNDDTQGISANAIDEVLRNDTMVLCKKSWPILCVPMVRWCL